MKRKKRKSRSKISRQYMNAREKTLSIILIVLLLVLIGVVLNRSTIQQLLKHSLSSQQLPEESIAMVTPTPTPYPPVPEPLPTGKQVYGISRGTGSPGPDMQELTVDPFDPKVGGKQTMTVSVKYLQPVDTVTITLISDKKQTPYQLKLSSGTVENGVWSGTWTTNDTHDLIYKAVIKAQSGKDISSVTPSFR